MSNHLDELLARRPELEASRSQIVAAFELLEQCFRGGNKLLLCGNGGSASDAEHWAGELLKGFESKRPLPDAAKQGLPDEVGDRLQDALPAIPLTGFTSLRSAVANDIDAVYEYAQLVWGLGRSGDLLVAISTSGNASNVCRAAEVAAARGMRVLGLTGRDGGKLRGLTDLCLCMPETRTLLVQELHLAVYHTLSLMLEEAFFGRSGGGS